MSSDLNSTQVIFSTTQVIFTVVTRCRLPSLGVQSTLSHTQGPRCCVVEILELLYDFKFEVTGVILLLT